MARTSALVADARRKARDAAMAARERETLLLEAATKYFVHTAEAEEVEDSLRERIHDLRIEADKERAELMRQAARQAQTMIDSGLTFNDAAQRLITTPAALKKLLKEHTPTAAPGEHHHHESQPAD